METTKAQEKLDASSFLENTNKLDDAPKILDDEEIEVRRRFADDIFFRS
jgi:hypothetical protein